MPILGTSRPRARRAAGSVPPSPLPPLRVLRLPAAGPEDVVVDGAGRVLTGTADGRILRVTLPSPGHGGRVEELARTGGRPLGLEPLPDGRLLVCDAHRGLLRVALEDGGRVEVLAAAVAGEPLRFCSNATAAPDGTVYFTVSSRRYGLDDWRADIVEHVGTGRLLRLAPGGEPEVLLDGLYFANGAALAPDASHVTVAETGARRLVRYWLTGPRAGRSDTFAEDLPGFPDNLSRDEDGTLWVALAGPREPLIDQLRRAPAAVRRAAAAAALRVPVPPRRVLRVMAFSPRGETVRDLARKGAGYRMVTSVAARAGTLVLGSLVEPGIAVCALPPGRA